MYQIVIDNPIQGHIEYKTRRKPRWKSFFIHGTGRYYVKIKEKKR